MDAKSRLHGGTTQGSGGGRDAGGAKVERDEGAREAGCAEARREAAEAGVRHVAKIRSWLGGHEEPQRVLHVFRAMNCGGAETAMMRVHRALREAGVQFDYAVMTREPAYYDAEVRRVGGRILALPDPRVDGPWAYSRALERTLHSAGPFLAVHSHVHYFSGVVLRAAEQAGVPVRIAHSHTVDGARPLWRAPYRGLMKILIQRHATNGLGASRAACRDLFGGEGRAGVPSQVVRNAIDLSFYCGLPRDRRNARREAGLPEDGVLVGHVGRFDRVKNHAFLIRVFAALARRLGDARLVLAGDGPLRPEIEELARNLRLEDRVSFLGVVGNVPRVLAALDLFVFPSAWEGLGLTLVEAQAAGVPCLASSRVPPEADLGIGLTIFRDVSDGPEEWGAAAAAWMGTPRPEWSRRETALRAQGYDVPSVANALSRTYSGAAVAPGIFEQSCYADQRALP